MRKDWSRLADWLLHNPDYFTESARISFDQVGINEIYLVDEPLNHLSLFQKKSNTTADQITMLIDDCDSKLSVYNGIWKVPKRDLWDSL